MIINAIAAIGTENQIAIGNKLPWNYPADLKIYRNKTKDKVQIMGRSTWESIPEKYRDSEHTIIVSKTMEDDALHISESVEDAISLAQDLDLDEVWIAGGVGIYREALELEVIHQLHISHIPFEGEADRFFPNFTQYIKSIKDSEEIFDKKNNKTFEYKTYILNELDLQSTYDSASTISVESASSSITAHDLESAMDVLRENAGRAPDTMIVNPVQFDYLQEVNRRRKQVDSLSKGLSWTTEENSKNPGDTFVRDGQVFMVSEDGEDDIQIADIDMNLAHGVDVTGSYGEDQKYYFDSGDYYDYMQKEILASYPGSVSMNEAQYSLEAFIRTKTMEYNPYCSIEQVSVNCSREAAPVYLRTGTVPIAFNHGMSQISVHYNILHGMNNYSFDININ